MEMAMGVVQREWQWWHRGGGGGSTETVAAVAAQRGRWQWHVESGWTVWAVCQCGWAAH